MMNHCARIALLLLLLFSLGTPMPVQAGAPYNAAMNGAASNGAATNGAATRLVVFEGFYNPT